MKIKLTQGKFAIIDDADWDLVSGHTWCAQKGGNTWYAVTHAWRGGKKILLSMHRLIMDSPEGMVVDHLNSDGLDNRRENFRICTVGENAGRQRVQTHPGKSSIYKGVSFRKDLNSWRAYITVADKYIHLGHFHSQDDAARAYNEAALELHGPHSILNEVA